MQGAPSSDNLGVPGKLVASVRERHIDASRIRDTRAAISDLGESGMFMEMSDPPPKGTILEVEFELPGGEARKKVLGIVRWREKAGPRSGVGVRFVSELENGKPTLEIEKVLRVLSRLGLEVTITPRGRTA